MYDFENLFRRFLVVRDLYRQGARLHDGLTSRANIRQLAFLHLDSEYRVATAADAEAGRGLTIHNLHCSEVARWPGDIAETMASLRAAVPKDGEIVLESTPNGAGGTFYEEWQHADETGYTRHFFPWWYDEDYQLEPNGTIQPLTTEEQGLVSRAGLTDSQIAWRRVKHAQLRGLAVQEYAEDAISCFRASGECVFDMPAIDRAFTLCGEPICAKRQSAAKHLVSAEWNKRFTSLEWIRPEGVRRATTRARP
jgi:hypothetical protein